MNRKIKNTVVNYSLELDKCLDKIIDIHSEIEDISENEQESIDNLSDYPQFMDRMMDIEYTNDKLVSIKDNLEEGIRSLKEALELLKEI